MRFNVYKGGQSWNGAHRDAGKVIHIIEATAIPNGYFGGKSLCGLEPGKHSYGWVNTEKEATCPKCILKNKSDQ